MSAESAFHNLRYLRMDARRLEHLASLMLPLRGKTVLETGAGIGDLTAFFLDRGCTVTSLEPRRGNVEAFGARYRNGAFWPPTHGISRVIEADAGHFALLQRNLESRGLAGNGSPLHVAIADTALTYRTRTMAGNSGATWLAAGASATAAAARLDDVHRAGGETRRVALIKIDVEGMELSVLNSATAMTDADRPLLYLEISAEQFARHGTTAAQVEDFLRHRSYRLFRNMGERNSNHDRFQLVELPNVAAGGSFFDLLAIPQADARLARALAFGGNRQQWSR